MSENERETRLERLTWWELPKTDTIFIPIGPMEAHGKHLPMGCDKIIAEAVGVLASRKAGGIVHPPIPCSFPGGTATFWGTVSISMETEMRLLKELIIDSWDQGYRVIFILSIHGPNKYPITVAIRDLGEKGIIACPFNPYAFVDERKYGYDDHAKEAAMCIAAMEVLGHPIPSMDGIENEECVTPYLHPKLLLYGSGITHFFTEIGQHVPIRKVEIEVGRQMLKEAVAELVSLIEPLREHAKKGRPVPPHSIKPWD